MSNAIEAYPLAWPTSRPRTPHHARERARFDTSFARARDEVVRHIEMMCGRYEWMKHEAAMVISTNLQLRRDGLPLAAQGKLADPGVAVYFTYKKRQMCFACDRWDSIEDNMQAVAKTIDALRGVANYCAFMWHHGWSTAPAESPARQGGAVAAVVTGRGAKVDGAWLTEFGNSLPVGTKLYTHAESLSLPVSVVRDAIEEELNTWKECKYGALHAEDRVCALLDLRQSLANALPESERHLLLGGKS